ncbi:MAG: hypothetical protein ABIP54_03405 [Candidatus Andersenbacteria bacterium]
MDADLAEALSGDALFLTKSYPKIEWVQRFSDLVGFLNVGGKDIDDSLVAEMVAYGEDVKNSNKQLYYVIDHAVDTLMRVKEYFTTTTETATVPEEVVVPQYELPKQTDKEYTSLRKIEQYFIDSEEEPTEFQKGVMNKFNYSGTIIMKLSGVYINSKKFKDIALSSAFTYFQLSGKELETQKIPLEPVWLENIVGSVTLRIISESNARNLKEIRGWTFLLQEVLRFFELSYSVWDAFRPTPTEPIFKRIQSPMLVINLGRAFHDELDEEQQVILKEAESKFKGPLPSFPNIFKKK